MSSRRAVALGVVSWLLVVTAGAGLVWAVISRAGEGVASSAQPSVEPDAANPRPADQAPRSAREATTGRQTWSDAAGYVTALCQGAEVSLGRAQPNPGWRIEVDETGPAQVEVELESTDERTRVRVTAACFDGDPAFEVDVRDKS